MAAGFPEVEAAAQVEETLVGSARTVGMQHKNTGATSRVAHSHPHEAGGAVMAVEEVVVPGTHLGFVVRLVGVQ